MVKVIHQTWETKDNLPKKFKKEWLDSWKQKNPGWEVKWWDCNDRRDLIKEYYPRYLSLFDGYNKNIHRADVFRYFLLHKWGGLYADMDCECLRPIDELFDNDITLGKGYIPAHGLGSVPSVALMYSIPGNSFWEFVFERLDFYDSITKKSEVMAKTGPLMLADRYLEYGDREKIKLLDSDIFIWDVSNVYVKTGYVSHHVSGTWGTFEDKPLPDIFKLEIL